MASDESKLKLKKLVKELEKIRGRHTELVTVYIPQGYSITDIISQLKQEQGTAANIKSDATKKNVLGALEKAVQHLKIYKKTPQNGLALFSGNVSEKEGQTDIKVWGIEPPDPVKVKLYWCDQVFRFEPLKEQLKEKEVYGLVVMDNSEATVGLLVGKSIRVLSNFSSIVPGKTSKGGQSAQRFERVRAGLLNDWYKKIAETMKRTFEEHEVKGILLGGPGPAKETLKEGDYIFSEIKNKIMGTVNTGYTDEHGLHEMVTRGKDIISSAPVHEERELLKNFFSELQKETGLVSYGLQSVLKVLTMGAVEKILLSENFVWQEVELECVCGNNYKKFVKIGEESEQKCEKCGGKMGLIGVMDPVDAFEALASQHGSEVVIISSDTSEGEQFLNMGGIGAFLRYRV